MRANPAHFSLTAQPTLEATLHLLAKGGHTPLAGGTELMVALAAGRLPRRPLLSIAHLRELRFIEGNAHEIILGGASTFTDLRQNQTVARDLPLLALAASWTGSIANQNRATLAGNLVNASPAADSSPALLCYEATVTLISAHGTRSVPYTNFHLGYKRTAIRPDELLHSVRLRRDWSAWKPFLRKVGTRNAQAISKIALATLTLVEDGTLRDIRIAAASLGEVPMRCRGAEQALIGQPLTPQTISRARAALLSEAKPIDDIRSTAAYRAGVAANLLQESVEALLPPAG